MSENYDILQADRDPESYRQLASLLGIIATHHNGVLLDSGTLTRWGDIMALTREVDDYVDIHNPSIGALRHKLTTFSDFNGSYGSLAPSEETTEIRERLLFSAERAVLSGKEVAAATTCDMYVSYRADEAHATAEFFADSASETVRSQENFSIDFMNLLRSMGAAACLLDSAHDLPKDYNEGLTLLHPTFKNRARLLSASFDYAQKTLPVLKHPRVHREMLKAANNFLGRRMPRLEQLTKAVLGTPR